MADNNKNPRRTIWLSETEPLSHYDIWLSKNQHLNSDGEPLSDSGVLRPCDYIFKVWDCDNWYPIIGLNSTAVNKINTVYNTSYTTTHNGHSINSSSYLEFHLPLFTSPNSSPLELFDAGTIGGAILEYVTELEWLNIFEGDAFSNSFELYFENIVNEGDININTLLKPAEANKLGGIWADEFSIEEMFPDTEENHYYTSSQINDSYNWIALAKYKYNHNISSSHLDYNLYVSAKDIIGAINTYITNNPEAPGIQPSNDFEWRLANTEEIGGIKAGIHSYGVDVAFKPIECKFYPNLGSWSSIHERLCINARDVIDSIIESFSDPNENWLFGNHGITIGLQLGGNRIEWAIDGLGTANNGQYARCKVTEGINRHSIEWVDLPEMQTYTRLGNDSDDLHDYVVKGGGNDKQFLNGYGEWAIPEGTQYTEGGFIKISEGVIDVKANPANGSFYLRSNDGGLSWASVPEQQEYSVLSQNDHSTGPYVINGCGNVSSPEDLFLNGNGEWKNILSGGTEEYDAGDGIEILTPQLGNKIIKGNIKECDLNGYNSGFSADTSIEFRASSGGSIIKNVVTLNIDGGNLNGGSTYDLLPYTYTKINLASNGTINFIIDGQTSYVNGNPIYVILSIPDKTYSTYTINIKDSLNNNSNDFISINNALVSDSSSIKFGCDVNKFLITMLFGIVKVEPLGYIESNRTEPEPEPEPSEP